MTKMMRTVPALFVGRRSLVIAEKICETPDNEGGYRCGACNSIILSETRLDIMDVVVKCGCGEYNQI